MKRRSKRKSEGREASHGSSCSSGSSEGRSREKALVNSVIYCLTMEANSARDTFFFPCYLKVSMRFLFNIYQREVWFASALWLANLSAHHQLQSCRHRRSHQPWEMSWSHRQSELWQRHWSSAGTAWRAVETEPQEYRRDARLECEAVKLHSSMCVNFLLLRVFKALLNMLDFQSKTWVCKFMIRFLCLCVCVTMPEFQDVWTQ